MAGRFARTFGVLALAVMMAPAAQAMQDGWFLEVAVGQANFSGVRIADLEERTIGFFDAYSINYVIDSSTLKHKDRSYALISGYRFNRQLALEVGYIRLGAFQYHTTGNVGSEGGIPADFSLGFRAKGVSFGVAGSLPLGEVLELRGRAGLSTSDTRIKFQARAQGSGISDRYSASSQDFYVGGGVGVNIGYYYRIGVDWMRHRNMGKSRLTYSTNVDNLMVSFNYQY